MILIITLKPSVKVQENPKCKPYFFYPFQGQAWALTIDE